MPSIRHRPEVGLRTTAPPWQWTAGGLRAAARRPPDRARFDCYGTAVGVAVGVGVPREVGAAVALGCAVTPGVWTTGVVSAGAAVGPGVGVAVRAGVGSRVGLGRAVGRETVGRVSTVGGGSVGAMTARVGGGGVGVARAGGVAVAGGGGGEVGGGSVGRGVTSASSITCSVGVGGIADGVGGVVGMAVGRGVSVGVTRAAAARASATSALAPKRYMAVANRNKMIPSVKAAAGALSSPSYQPQPWCTTPGQAGPLSRRPFFRRQRPKRRASWPGNPHAFKVRRPVVEVWLPAAGVAAEFPYL